MSLTLAFDIERSGGGNTHETIGIGASVVDNNFEERDSLFLPGYFPKSHKTPTVFEQRCWDEFWCKQSHTLDLLEYTGDLTKEERQKEMIVQFQEFRAKWEQYANDNNLKLELVADNNVYDGGFINDMIFKYLPDTLPLPYTAGRVDGKQQYKSFWETHSEQRGLLAVVDPSFKQNWGYTKRIAELYEVPDQKKDHDHNPSNDAYSIAFEHQVLLNIRDGKIQRRV